MTASGQRRQGAGTGAVLWPAPQAGRTEPPRARRFPDWTLAVPAAVTLIVMLWGLTGPSYWKDESATLSAADRSVPQLLRMLGRVDAVHGLYYLLLLPVVHVFGTGESAARLPSALAMAAAALGVAATGRRLRSRTAGLFAGLVFAGLPMVSLRGHDARPYALETAAAVLASYLLLRAAGQPDRRRFAAYGGSLVLLGYLHLFGLLILPAHALALIPAARRASARRGDQPETGLAGQPGGMGRRAGRRWAVTVLLAGAAVAPLAWLGWQQRWAIGWLPRPSFHDLPVLVSFLVAGTVASAPVFALLIAAGLARSCWPRGERAGRPDPALAWLAVPWLVLPPAVLLIASEVKPVYEVMYVEYCLPAVALLAGAGLAVLGPPLRLAVLALVVMLGLPAQLAIRQPAANGYLGSAAQLLARHERPGDAVYYPGNGVPAWSITYPDGFGRLRAIQLDQTAAQAGRLVGTSWPLSVVERRLHGVRRLWLVEESRTWLNPPLRLGPDFRLALTWQRGQVRIRLYIRPPTA